MRNDVFHDPYFAISDENDNLQLECEKNDFFQD